jgi:hypothetical protein
VGSQNPPKFRQSVFYKVVSVYTKKFLRDDNHIVDIMLYGRRVAKSIKWKKEKKKENVIDGGCILTGHNITFCLYCLFNVVCRIFSCTSVCVWGFPFYFEIVQCIFI